MDEHKTNSVNDLNLRVFNACSSDNLKEIKEILLTDCYPNLSQDEKEFFLLGTTISLLQYTSSGHDILKYLILDYGIKESPSFDSFMIEEVREMFVKRRLNEELSAELVDSNKPMQKVKI